MGYDKKATVGDKELRIRKDDLTEKIYVEETTGFPTLRKEYGETDNMKDALDLAKSVGGSDKVDIED